MPAAKPLPLEELAASRGQLSKTELTRRYHALTGYGLTETAPLPKALLLLSGTDRPAKARAKLERYLRFGILTVDQKAVGERYADPAETRSFALLVASFTRRRSFSEGELRRFFSQQRFTASVLLYWAAAFAETRKALRQSANARSGFQPGHRAHKKRSEKST